MTNHDAVSAVSNALNAGRILTVTCNNGDKITVSKDRLIRWGHSQWALPSGREYSGNIPAILVEHVGRGKAMEATK